MEVRLRQLSGSIWLTHAPKIRQAPFAKWLLALLIVGIILIQLSLLPEGAWARFLGTLSDTERLLRLTVPMFVGLLFALLVWLVQQRERLLIDDQGIRYQAPFRWWPTQSFQLRWSEIDRMVLVPHRRPALEAVLELKTARGDFRLRPFQWHFPEIDWAERSPLLRLRQPDAATLFARSAIGQILTARGHEVEIGLVCGPLQGFDLFSRRTSKILVITTFALLFYALFDAMAVEYRYLDFQPFTTLLLLGTVASVIVIPLLLSDKVPVPETLGISMLFGLSIGLAGHSTLLRVNALTDANGGTTVSYVRLGADQFAAAGFPDIAVDPIEPFWDAVGIGQHYEFRLYRGSLGFWQWDEEPVNDAMRAFYRARRGESD